MGHGRSRNEATARRRVPSKAHGVVVAAPRETGTATVLFTAAEAILGRIGAGGDWIQWLATRRNR